MNRQTLKQVFADWRALLSLCIPMLIASLSEMILNLTDTAFIGRLGASDLAAVSIATAIYAVFIQILAALGIGYQIVAAKSFGEGNKSHVSLSLFHTAMIMIMMGIVFFLLLWCSGGLLNFYTSDPDTIRGALVYLQFRSPSILFFSILILLRMTFDSNRQTKPGMYITMIMAGLNILLDYLLIFGIGIFPEMGIAGAALASTIATFTGLILFIMMTIRSKIINLPEFKFKAKEGLRIVKLSGPEMINAALDYSGNLIFVLVISMLGTSALAGGRLSTLVLMTFFIVALNFGMGVQILMGRKLGENKITDMERILKNNRLFMLTFLAFFGLFIIIWPKIILLILTNSSEVIEASIGAVTVIGFTMPFIGWTTIYVGALRSLGKTKEVMYTNLSSIWLIQLPVAWMAGIYLGHGLAGVYAGFFAYFLVRAILSHLLFNMHFKKRFIEEKGVETAI